MNAGALASPRVDTRFRPLPEDIDLTGMDYMPLYLARLMKSRAWLRAKHWTAPGPGLGFAMMNLWARAFQEVPAGSIDDDDDVLMDAAMVGPRDWPAMREAALRGWVKHAGRLHHPVVCELVWNVWRARLEARHENAMDSWRAATRRAENKGRDAPVRPGNWREWLERHYPVTAAYLRDVSADFGAESGDEAQSSADALPLFGGADGVVGVTSSDSDGVSPGRRDDKHENPPDIGPKVSEAVTSTPLVVPPAGCGQEAPRPARAPPVAGGGGLGKGMDGKARGSVKGLGQKELQRLRREFGEHAEGLIRLLAGGKGERHGAVEFVRVFGGCGFDAAVLGVIAPSSGAITRIYAAGADALNGEFGDKWRVGERAA